MVIDMLKQKEDTQYVWYKFEMQTKTEEKNKDQRGREQFLYESKYGVFKFNKTVNLEEHLKSTLDVIIEIDKKETDPCFWENQMIILACLRRMLECKKSNNFPERLAWVSCDS